MVNIISPKLARWQDGYKGSCCGELVLHSIFFEELEAQNNLEEVAHYDTDSDDDENNL